MEIIFVYPSFLANLFCISIKIGKIRYKRINVVTLYSPGYGSSIRKIFNVNIHKETYDSITPQSIIIKLASLIIL